MKTLKKLGIGILIVIAIPLIVALFVPKDFTYEKSIKINAPIDSVWIYTSSLSGLDKWSPWNDYDPAMKKVWTGVDGTVGAKQSWESDVENVGVGSQTIVNIQAPNLFETDLHFIKPFESKSNAYVKLVDDNGVTDATWGFSGSMPYPFNLMNLFMDMEKDMGKDWDNGLAKLKKLAEE